MNKHLLAFAVVFLGCMVLFSVHYMASQSRYRPQRINVRWADAVTPSMREEREIRFRLSDPRHDSERTWSYIPQDTSNDNIRQLVRDTAVEDTHNIDRTRFELIDEGPSLLRPMWFTLWSTMLGLIAAVLAQRRSASQLDTIARTLGIWYRTVQSFLTRAVPDLSARALGVFRMFWAALLFVMLMSTPLTLEAGVPPSDGELGWRWLHWMAMRPDLMASLKGATLSLLVLFAVGLFARVAYLLAAAGMVVWILVWIESQHSNAHVWLPMFLTIVCLIPVPWGDALSLDERLRRRLRADGVFPAVPHSRAYGFAVWIPGFVLGSLWASAAYAKLQTSGLEWISGAAVKYHWVIDSRYAPTEWGLWIASHHAAAVIMSFCGVFFEAIFIASVFVKSHQWRFALTSTGLALLVGFYLFQGVFWLPWWLVFISFAMPWGAVSNLLDSHVPKQSSGANWVTQAPVRMWHRSELQPVHFALIALICLHALVRLPAGFGRFTAYATTYPSTEAFDRSDALDPVDRLWLNYETPEAVEVDADVARDAILTLTQHEPLSAEHIRQLSPLKERFDQSAHRTLTLTRARPTFDWSRGRFNPPGLAVVVGTLDLESLRLITK